MSAYSQKRTFEHSCTSIRVVLLNCLAEFARELKERGYVTGRMDNGQAVALVDPHVAVAELV